MPISLPASLVEHILLGPLDDRRQLQDSPILGDVWVAFGAEPDKRIDLLIEPYNGQHAGSVATTLDEDLHLTNDDAKIAFLQNLIVAGLEFSELMRVVVPKTDWWLKKKQQSQTGPGSPSHTFTHTRDILGQIIQAAHTWHQTKSVTPVSELSALDRLWVLVGLILWARKDSLASTDQILRILDLARNDIDDIEGRLRALADAMLRDRTPEPLVWQVSRNRRAVLALSKSVPAVKADAAKTLFRVDCSDITWAVLDSGIDGSHPALADTKGKTRVKRSFNFQNFRQIVSLGNAKEGILKRNLAELRKQRGLKHKLDDNQACSALKRLAEDARNRGPIHWELVEKFVEIEPDNPDTMPGSDHGTHVAGIIGASRQGSVDAIVRRKAEAEAARRKAETEAAVQAQQNAELINGERVREAAEGTRAPAVDPPAVHENPDFADGMCPDISLYDFRVLGQSIDDTEFAIIAAMQFIRYLNELDVLPTVHGVNMSVSIPHDVRNFACGRTPVCEEADRLVSTGVVVVAAAGNHGYKSFETKDGSFESYAAFSITDPGNADSVITVGSTHRFWPHTYGVSFFSSRGPTGDGRMKPDLVAPGERIRGPFRHGAWGDLDGTSMAAPHVSGAAAMLMARYSELVRQPLRIKRILCEGATDLGRERSFQGHGMLDVLRAFQSI